MDSNEAETVPQTFGGIFSSSRFNAWNVYFENALGDLLTNEATCTWNPADLVDRASNIADFAIAAEDMAKVRYK